jgi:hypothetical protein
MALLVLAFPLRRFAIPEIEAAIPRVVRRVQTQETGQYSIEEKTKMNSTHRVLLPAITAMSSSAAAAQTPAG